MKPKILITNDDSITAPGLRALYDALAPMADLWIVAPEVEQSGVGLSVTLRRPLTLNAVKWEGDTVAMKVNGTPADCVRIALNLVLKEKPDLIVSGINRGSNAGRNLLYSGTVGGVIEAALRGFQGIAFSYDVNFSSKEPCNPNYDEIALYIQAVVQHVLDTPLPKGNFLNVNFPEKSGIQGVKLAFQGRSYIKEKLQKGRHPEGNAYYWMGYDITEHEEPEGSDVYWLKKGYVAAVPVHIDEITDHVFLKERKEAFEAHFSSLVD